MYPGRYYLSVYCLPPKNVLFIIPWLQKTSFTPKRTQLTRDERIQVHALTAIHWTPRRIQKKTTLKILITTSSEAMSLQLGIKFQLDFLAIWWIRCKLAATLRYAYGGLEHVNKLVFAKALTFNILNS